MTKMSSICHVPGNSLWQNSAVVEIGHGGGFPENNWVRPGSCRLTSFKLLESLFFPLLGRFGLPDQLPTNHKRNRRCLNFAPARGSAPSLLCALRGFGALSSAAKVYWTGRCRASAAIEAAIFRSVLRKCRKRGGLP